MYALSGQGDVKALVSFHGGLTDLPSPSVNVIPKVLVLSGGEDDTATSIIDLENNLNTANAIWEITRYSGIEHGFTKFDSNAYNDRADKRSWNSMKGFLAEAFGTTPYEGNRPEISSTTPIGYTDIDGTELQGYLALPEGAETTDVLPAVIIVSDKFV